MHARLSAVGLAATLLFGCSSSQAPAPLKGDTGAQGPAGPQGPAGATGASGPNGFTTLVVNTPEPAGSHCSEGGMKLQTALDQNANGVVDPGEIDLASTQYVCNGAQGTQGTTGATGSTGATGASGLNSALRTTSEPVGVNCATGGVKVEAGLDGDANGLLADAEVDASLTRYVCNGAQGSQGPIGLNGLSSAVSHSVEAPGGNCATGGIKIEAGLDANGNGTLDAAEVDASLTQYVCNGAQGPQGIPGGPGMSGFNAAMATSLEPAGANCATGGVQFQAGIDANGNGVLDPGEVDASLTRYVCNGAQGPQGVPGGPGMSGFNAAMSSSVEAPGANCATGGVQFQAGIDANGNGVLDPAEVNASLTRYVCNGAQGPQGIPGGAGANGFNAAISTSSEPAGANCATAGVQFQAGIDANANGALDPGEVNPTLTRYVCNGAQGSQGVTGPQGPAGSLGVYGDGSAGALNITSTVDWTTSLPAAGGNLQFTDITISGHLTVPSGTVLRATGNVTISGTLTVATGTADNGAFGIDSYQALPGVARAAANSPMGGIGLTRMAALGLVRGVTSGGGAGAHNGETTSGDGGGAFAIHASGSIVVTATGAIRADGLNGPNSGTILGNTGGGGGAGGVVVLLAKSSLSVAGTITVNGGNGAPGNGGIGGAAKYGGGGGGGGIVHLLSSTNPSIAGSIQASGGSAGAANAGSGTPPAAGGGGACGGNGGSGGSSSTTASSGSAGYVLTTVSPTPENLAL